MNEVEKWHNSVERAKQMGYDIPELSQEAIDMFTKIQLMDLSSFKVAEYKMGIKQKVITNDLEKVKQAFFYGVTIQEKLYGEWVDQPRPVWDARSEYKIKP